LFYLKIIYPSKFYRLHCSKDGHVDYSNSVGIDIVNYEQGQTTLAIINPWSLQLCKKQAEKLHRQLIGDENGTVSQSKITYKYSLSRREESCKHKLFVCLLACVPTLHLLVQE